MTTPPGRLLYRLRLAVFLAALAGWTFLLLQPKPVPEVVLRGIGWFDWEMLYFVLAKALHLGVYAGLALLGGSLVRPGRRWTVYLALVLHGAGTEIGQVYVPNRFGSVRDVVIDAVGVAAGAGVGRISFRRLKSRATTD
jgi:VanZ family protein